MRLRCPTTSLGHHFHYTNPWGVQGQEGLTSPAPPALGNWETSSAHTEAPRTRTNAGPRGKVTPEAPNKLCLLPVSNSAGNGAPQLSPGEPREKPGDFAGRVHGDGGDREDGVDGDKLVWGLVRGSRGGRAHTRAHTDTRSTQTRAHTRARTRGRGSPRRACGGPLRLLPTPGDGTCWLGRGPGGSYRGHERRCRVPRAPRVLVCGGPVPGRAARRRLRGDRARRLRCHFIPGPARRRGRPEVGGDARDRRAVQRGGARGPRVPGPRGGAGGTARGPGHALLPARPRRRPRPGVAARGPSRGLEPSRAHPSVSAVGLATAPRNTPSAHRPT